MNSMATTTTIIPQIFINLTLYKVPRKGFPATKLSESTNSFTRRLICSNHQHRIRIVVSSNGNSLLSTGKYCLTNHKQKKRMVLARFNNLGGGSGGGGGRDDGNTGRVLGNLAVAIGLTYLSFTGQLGWLFDAIVSIWLLAVLVPIVGLGALIWWAGRDMVQSNCPNCGNEFQVFRSTLNDEMQQCPYCTQPFSVVGDEFVRDPVKFSNESTTFGEAFRDLSSRSKKGKASSTSVIDIEAEVKDVE